MSDVVAAIQKEIDAFDGTVGVAAKHLGTGEEIGVNADDETGTASTVKVPILIELFRQVEAGEVDLETKIADSAETRTPGSGILRDLSVGNPLSVRDVAILMIIVSDNTATNLILDRVTADLRAQAAPGFEDLQRDFGSVVERQRVERRGLHFLRLLSI